MAVHGKKIKLTKVLLNQLAECFFLAFTDEQAAEITGVSVRTLQRMRANDDERWREIEAKSFELEKPYRRKIWKGEPGWQGAAWMLERKYASQLSKPEVQLNIANTLNTTHQTLVVTAEVADQLASRAKTMDAETSKLIDAKTSKRAAA